MLVKRKLGKAALPWDLVVFLTITTVGFGYSISRFGGSTNFGGESETEIRELASAASPDLYDLGCLENRLSSGSFISETRSLRLKGKFCSFGKSQMRAFQGMRVKNLSTGYESTVFLRGTSSAFISDHVELKNGKNILELEWRESPSAPVRRLVTEVFEK